MAIVDDLKLIDSIVGVQEPDELNGQSDDEDADVKFLAREAIKAAKEERFDDFAEITKMLAERVPAFDSVVEMSAAAYLLAGHSGKAIELLEELCEKDPESSSYSMQLADAYQARGWRLLAAEQYKKTIELDPRNRRAYAERIDCYVMSKKKVDIKQLTLDAIAELKAQGMESVRLYAYAFTSEYYSYSEDDEMRYLRAIINIMKTDDDYPRAEFHRVVDELLDIVEDTDGYDILPYIREMVDIIPGVHEEDIEDLGYFEMKSEVESLYGIYPNILCDLLSDLRREVYADYDEDYDEENALNEKMGMECSILADLDGYRPHLKRLSTDHPKLYEMYSEFFDMAATLVDPEKLLNAKINALHAKGLEPLLSGADGREIKTKRDSGTYRRESPKIGRNDPCPCGSGKKYKKCCGA